MYLFIPKPEYICVLATAADVWRCCIATAPRVLSMCGAATPTVSRVLSTCGALAQGRIQSNVVGGGVPELLGVRARRREAPSSKCDRGSAKRLPRELRHGSGGAKIGLLES